ncbi:MAG: GIY-YIG nuclease family protein [Crocinitomicaceae bacterium]|nr:GIY-YIG nuclease family protein [Crocinitomicaceae bacterium]MCB9223073.1 GIY-YIG nuclease family protein [Crocinitomicaceae bacterium]MCB9223074.1 GIY-YIG nuclease family protein [Crocinitomicaceae bacterium]
MEFVVYILWSQEHDQIYIGFTENLIQRYHWHNHGPKGYTLRYRPWKVVHVQFFESKSEALKREKLLKGGQGRIWIRENLNKEAGFISA